MMEPAETSDMVCDTSCLTTTRQDVAHLGEAGACHPSLSGPSGVDHLVLAEQVRLLYSRSVVAQATVIVNATIVTCVFWGIASRAWSAAWLAVIYAIAALRAFSSLLYVKRNGGPAKARVWARLFTVGAALNGIAWGAAAFVFYSDRAPAHRIFVAFVLGGMTAGAAAANSSYGPAFMAFAVPALLPMTTRLFFEGDGLHRAMGFMTALFGVAVARIAHTGGRVITESVRLRVRSEALVQSFEREVQDHEGAMQALRESEDLFRNLAENSNVGVYLIQDGIFRYVNPQLATIFGYTPGEIIGRLGPRDLTHLEDRSKVAENIRKRLSGETPSIHYEFRGTRNDGTTILAEVFGTRTIYRSRTAIVGTLLDVTQRRRIERELSRVDKLESLGVLAGGIAHDFNNLLAAILGDLSLARRDAAHSTPLAEVLAEAEQAALRARDLTAQLLTFSKGGEPIKKRVSLADLVKTSASFASRGSRVKCEFTLAPDLWPVEVDEGQMSQVVHNLVLNAVQAMPAGGTMHVRAANVFPSGATTSADDSGRAVSLTVEDHGVGITDEVRNKIFDPFFTTKAGGTGLGLASAYSIVKRHGGDIDVESEPGKGSTFSILLPATQGPVETAPTQAPSPRGRGRILLMDDEELVRRAAGRILTRLGFDMTAARDGAEAVTLYESALETGMPFDAVIMDLTVPGGLGGKEAVSRIRRIDPGVRAIASSGYSNDPVMADFRLHGFAGALPKPYQVDDLGNTLRRVLPA
jgi:two-component system, cell cycle sensor histidine kinase and response regulator CckA